MENIEISQLIRSRRRSVALMITADARLKVYAPLFTPLAYIEELVKKKSAWIARKVGQARSRPVPQPLEFSDGCQVFYLGQAYTFESHDGSRIQIKEKFLFPRDLLPQAREELNFWYRQEAAKVIPERVGHYARTMGVKYSRVQISQARTRWGSCSPQDNLRFSWRLIMAPLAVLDYVVVHELAHILVRNHSRKFWDKVREFYPDYQPCRAWLRKHSNLIRSFQSN